MSFEILMGTFGLGIAAMLAIMGGRQWKMGFRIAGGLSILVAVVIVVAMVWLGITYL